MSGHDAHAVRAAVHAVHCRALVACAPLWGTVRPFGAQCDLRGHPVNGIVRGTPLGVKVRPLPREHLRNYCHRHRQSYSVHKEATKRIAEHRSPNGREKSQILSLPKLRAPKKAPEGT